MICFVDSGEFQLLSGLSPQLLPKAMGSHQHWVVPYWRPPYPSGQQLGWWLQWGGGGGPRDGSGPGWDPNPAMSQREGVLFLTDVLSLSHTALTRRMSLLSLPNLPLSAALWHLTAIT